MLACLGAQVTLLERSAEVHDLLRDALARAAAESPELAAVVARMTLMQGDARDLLPGLRADAVIVDPMHPPRTNSAEVKQEMRLLRDLVGTDPDAHRTDAGGAGRRLQARGAEMAAAGGAAGGTAKTVALDHRQDGAL